MHHVISVEQFDMEEMGGLFDLADQIREECHADGAERRALAQRYMGEQLCSLFYEPSTRTRLSFEQGAAKFGMGVVSTENAREFSSATKGESIEDTIRVLDEYDFGVVVMRHHETGAAARAAAVARTPIINAGDGKGEHPTQALLDVYSVNRYKGQLDGLNVVIGGDLARGRTARSLAKLLSLYDKNRLIFVSTPEFSMADDVKKLLDQNDTAYEETDQMNDALREADVVYWTRMQKERSLDEVGKGTGASEQEPSFVIDSRSLEVMKEDAIILHPLPRVGEISEEVDADPRAKYFQQTGNGLYVRMALMQTILETKAA